MRFAGYRAAAVAGAVALAAAATPALATADTSADAKQIMRTVRTNVDPGAAMSRSLDGMVIPAASNVDVESLGRGLLGVIDRGSGEGSLIDMSSGNGVSIDPGLLQILDGISPELGALRGLINSGSSGADLLKDLVGSGKGLDTEKLGKILDSMGSSGSSDSPIGERLRKLLDSAGSSDSLSSGSSEGGFTPDSLLSSGSSDGPLSGLLDKVFGGSSGSETPGTSAPGGGQTGSGNSTSMNTQGLQPGTYTLNGTWTDEGGTKHPVKFNFTVSPNAGDTNLTPGNNSGSNSTGNSQGTGAGSGTNSGVSNNTAGVAYTPVSVPAGGSATTKPTAVPTGTVFTKASDDPDWFTVARDGTVTVSPGANVSPGDYTLSVAAIKEKDLDSVADNGPTKENTSIIQIRATVTGENSGGSQSQGGGQSAAPTPDAQANQPVIEEVTHSTGGDGQSSGTTQSQRSTPSTTTQRDTMNSGGPRSPRANSTQTTGPNPGTERGTTNQAAGESLPVTGANTRGLAVAALGLVVAGVAGLVYARRKASAG